MNGKRNILFVDKDAYPSLEEPELFDTLAAGAGSIRVERIVSNGQVTPEGCLRTFSFTHPLHEAGQRVKKSPIHDFTANLLFLKILSKQALSFFPQVPKKRLSFILVRAKKGFFTGCGSVW